MNDVSEQQHEERSVVERWVRRCASDNSRKEFFEPIANLRDPIDLWKALQRLLQAQPPVTRQLLHPQLLHPQFLQQLETELVALLALFPAMEGVLLHISSYRREELYREWPSRIYHLHDDIRNEYIGAALRVGSITKILEEYAEGVETSPEKLAALPTELAETIRFVGDCRFRTLRDAVVIQTLWGRFLDQATLVVRKDRTTDEQQVTGLMLHGPSMLLRDDDTNLWLRPPDTEAAQPFFHLRLIEPMPLEELVFRAVEIPAALDVYRFEELKGNEPVPNGKFYRSLTAFLLALDAAHPPLYSDVTEYSDVTDGADQPQPQNSEAGKTRFTRTSDSVNHTGNYRWHFDDAFVVNFPFPADSSSQVDPPPDPELMADILDMLCCFAYRIRENIAAKETVPETIAIRVSDYQIAQHRGLKSIQTEVLKRHQEAMEALPLIRVSVKDESASPIPSLSLSYEDDREGHRKVRLYCVTFSPQFTQMLFRPLMKNSSPSPDYEPVIGALFNHRLWNLDSKKYLVARHLARVLQSKVRDLERKQRQQRRRIFDVEDEISHKRDRLVELLEKRMAQKTQVESLFTIRWSVV